MPAVIRTITLALAALSLGALLLAPAASAQGNSGIDQYTETPPAADGEGDSAAFSDAGGGDAGSGGADDSALPADAREELEALGSDGEAAAAVAAATAPDAPSSGSGSQGSSRKGGPEQAGDSTGGGDGSSDSSGSVGGVLDALGGSGSDGLGIGLPLILAASLLGTIALVVAGRRSGSAGPPQG